MVKCQILLGRSNQELSAAISDSEPDPDFRLAIEENRFVIEKMRLKIDLIKRIAAQRAKTEEAAQGVFV